MTSHLVIVRVKLCLHVGKDEYTILCNLVVIFVGHIMSGFCHPSPGHRKQKTLN